MTKCPKKKCGKEITNLVAEKTETEIGYFVNGQEGFEYEYLNNLPKKTDKIIFSCPVCGSILFKSIKEAEEFLGG